MGHPVIVDINKAIKSFGLEIDMPDADHAPRVVDIDVEATANVCDLCGRRFKRAEHVILVPCLIRPSRAYQDLKKPRQITTQGHLCLNLKDCVARASAARSAKEQSLTSKLDALQQKVILP